MSYSFQTFTKPRPMPAARKALKKVSKKGDFWLFVSAILNKFFLKIEMPQRCEACDGSAYCGKLTPAHTRRRQDIRVGDWYYALRVAVMGVQCHYEHDVKGRRDAEPLIEAVIVSRFKKMGLSEERVKELLLQCAAEVQKENEAKGRFQEYVVTP